MNDMDKTKIRERIANAERELAEAKAELDRAKNPQPQQGEIWGDRDTQDRYLVCRTVKGYVAADLKDGLTWDDITQTPFGGNEEEFERIGTFNEVYIKRSYVNNALRGIRSALSTGQYGLVFQILNDLDD